MDNIARINGTHAIVYIDATPWHGLGTDVRKLLAATPREQLVDVTLDAAQLRYQVASVPMFLADGTEIAGHKLAVRLAADGSVAAPFGPVGEGHTHVQNERAVDIIRPLVERFNFVPATAGALGQGERAWMLLRAADLKIAPLPGDDVNGYGLLSWGHDGNVAVNFIGTGIRVVCQNTLNLALGKAKRWVSIRHTTSADARVDQAAKLVERLGEAMQATGDTFAKLARKGLSQKALRAYIDTVIPAEVDGKVSPVLQKRRDTIVELAHVGKGADLANQAVGRDEVSLWGAYNAVTEYWDHVRTAEASNASGLARAQESALFGGNAANKAAALQQAQALLAA